MFVSALADLKDLLEATLHLSRDALHVHIGLAIFLACAAVLRGERRVRLAFMVLVGVCLLSEVVDFSMAARKGSVFNWLGSVKDVVNTLLWPGIWLTAGPFLQRLLGPGPRPEPSLPRRRAAPTALIRPDPIQDPAR